MASLNFQLAPQRLESGPHLGERFIRAKRLILVVWRNILTAPPFLQLDA